jgi:serine carboxypeptidase-like clade II
VINAPTDERGLIDFAWSHFIISGQLYSDINKDCDFTTGNATNTDCPSHLNGLAQAYANIDIYNIYAPVCQPSAPKNATPHVSISANLNLPMIQLAHDLLRIAQLVRLKSD